MFGYFCWAIHSRSEAITKWKKIIAVHLCASLFFRLPFSLCYKGKAKGHHPCLGSESLLSPIAIQKGTPWGCVFFAGSNNNKKNKIINIKEQIKTKQQNRKNIANLKGGARGLGGLQSGVNLVFPRDLAGFTPKCQTPRK